MYFKKHDKIYRKKVCELNGNVARNVHHSFDGLSL